jgi:hypothetical protein
MNAMMADIPGKVFSAPQCVQRAPQIVSVCAICNMTALTSATATVRTTAPHSLQKYPLGFRVRAPSGNHSNQHPQRAHEE